MQHVPVLLISGPVGVGKTSTAEEVSNVLVREGVSHTLLDLDCLAETYPRPTGDRFGSELMRTNLTSVWRNCVAAGSRNLVLARVIEDEADLAGILSCIPNAAPTLCQLRARDDILIERVRRREIGTGGAWHEARSLELSASLRQHAPGDIWIDTDGRSVVDIAEELAAQVSWTP
ncbi:MAG: hypothetical protein AAGK00_02570 [Pseudomonadota bacterium]